MQVLLELQLELLVLAPIFQLLDLDFGEKPLLARREPRRHSA